MDEITLVAKLDNDTTLYLSSTHNQTCSEFVEDDILGGSDGYFIDRGRKDQVEIFGMLTAQQLRAS